MIELKDIQTAIVKRLTDNGNTVTAAEVIEGFSKPTFFINLFTNGTEVQNQFHELVNVGVELKYIPTVETREECVNKSEQVKQMFLQTPLPVEDRFLSVNEILFDIDESNLISYFELEFLQERNIQTKEYEKIENIEIGGVENYGSAADTH